MEFFTLTNTEYLCRRLVSSCGPGVSACLWERFVCLGLVITLADLRLDVQILVYLHIIHLLKSSTCFEHYPAHLQEVYFVIVYKGCPRRKGQNIGRVFLMLKYTDITQNTYIQSWTVTEIMAREKCGLLAGLGTVTCQLTAFRMSVLDCLVRLQKYRWRCYVSTPLWLTMHVMYNAWNP